MGQAFITGATGLVGSTLLKELIERTELEKFYVLVRDKNKAKSILEESINKAKNLHKSLFIVEGDIKKEDLGMSEKEIEEVKDSEEVYHLAALISLSKNNQEEIFKTNIDGTKNLLNLFKHSKKLDNLFYFSTAYVCGRDQGTLKEDWIKKPEKFRNPYEESKWLTESLIKEYMDNYKIPITIIRPTIIGSEDKSKFLQLSNQTIYLHGRIIRKATLNQKENKQIRVVGRENTFINLITIEDILKILLKIRSTEEKHLFYNLANPENAPALSFLEGLKETINFSSGYCFTDNLDFNDLTEAEKEIYQKTKHYFDYNLDTHIKWDTKNTENIRNELNLINKNEQWLKNHAIRFFSSIQDEK